MVWALALIGTAAGGAWGQEDGAGEASKHAEPWKRHTIDDSSKGADGVRVADANGDGLLDIATGWEEGGVVRVYLNPGPDKARAKWPAVTVGKAKHVEDAVLVDLDGDGALDVVSCSEGTTRTMHVHWAPKDPAEYLNEKAWTTQPIPATAGTQQWMYALPMQVDGKHGIDLVVGSKNKDAAVGWLEAPADPRELDKWTYHKIVDAGWIMSIEAWDVDGDERLDVVISDRKGGERGVKLLINPGGDAAATQSKWDRTLIGGREHEVMFLALKALATNERGAGIAVATRGGEILMGSAKAGSAPTPRAHELALRFANPFAIPHGKAVAWGDIDLDGAPDLVHTANTEGDRTKPGVAWVSFLGVDEQHHNISGPQGVKFDRIELIDLDGDGDLDVLTCEERDNLGVIWYENPTKRPQE